MRLQLAITVDIYEIIRISATFIFVNAIKTLKFCTALDFVILYFGTETISSDEKKNQKIFRTHFVVFIVLSRKYWDVDLIKQYHPIS